MEQKTQANHEITQSFNFRESQSSVTIIDYAGTPESVLVTLKVKIAEQAHGLGYEVLNAQTTVASIRVSL